MTTSSKQLWQCPTCGGILQKNSSTMAMADKVAGLAGNATCNYCGNSHSATRVYAGEWDFADSDQRIMQIASARIDIAYDESCERWRYRGQILKLAKDL